MTDINPVSIKELICKKYHDNFFNNHFVIPDYQRGYRWDEINVVTLLNDVHDFCTRSKDLKENYCLQPIVVSKIKTEDSNIYWEVIDGQQRLITLYLIINYLSSSFGQRSSYTISFEKRDKSNQFLSDLVIEKKEDHSNPDFHYMSQAYRIINKWFKEKSKYDLTYNITYFKNICDRVKVLFYEVECNSQEEKQVIFERLNIGKIPLSDAELIKALILSKIKGDLNERELNLRQAEIANEWDRIEIELRKPEKWLFLNVKEEYSSHIELLFDLIADPQDKKNYSTYLYFEKNIKDASASIEEGIEKQKKEAEVAEKLWREVKQRYSVINSWFCPNSPDKHPTLYHYVGYLLSTGHKKVEDLISLSSMDKDKFMRILKDSIRETIKGVKLNELSYETNYVTIKNVLLLFNVLTCDKISLGNNNRFAFDRYVKIDKQKANGGWSLEHIHAQNSQEPIKSDKVIRSWVEDTLRALGNITHIERDSEEEGEVIELANLINKLRAIKKDLEEGKKVSLDYFNEVKNEFINAFDSSSVHDISNMALLSKDDNSKLNNAIFPVKRDYIINLEKEGKFIPPCTRNVFLKFYSESNSQPYYWSSDDKRQYFNMIESTINDFLAE